MANATSTDKNEQQLVIQRRADGLALKSNQKNEQRLVPRYPLNVPVTLTNQIKRSEQMNTYAAWVAEIYHEVTKLLTTVGLFPEKHLFANFDPAIGRSLHLSILVTHCDKLIDGIYRGGGTFCFDPLSDASSSPAVLVQERSKPH